LLAPSLKPSLDSSLCRLASNVAIGIHGIAKKHGVDLGSPVRVANAIAAQWMQQHGSETSLVFVRDNGYLEIDVAIDPSSSSTEQQKPVATCEKSDNVGKTVYFLRLTLSPASFEPDEYQLYEKYQAQIHRDHRSTPDGYRRFLCDSGLAPSAQGAQDPMVWRLVVENGELSLALSTDISEFSHSEPFLGCGTFHLRYEVWFISDALNSFFAQLCHCDDASPRPAQLIAMSVLDVLPDGLSSVYFIYDTDYAHLSLGTLSATIELSIIEMWRQQCCTRVVFPSEHQSVILGLKR
jgi:arginyl-tRNA--protein-N-Asp/Glu arginylyltransferase